MEYRKTSVNADTWVNGPYEPMGDDLMAGGRQPGPPGGARLQVEGIVVPTDPGPRRHLGAPQMQQAV